MFVCLFASFFIKFGWSSQGTHTCGLKLDSYKPWKL